MNKKNKAFIFLITIPSLLLSSCIVHLFPNTSSSNYTDENGNTVYKYQSTNSEYKKENLTKDNVGINLGYRYLPSTGDRKILVVPIQFEDSQFTETQLERLKYTFFGESSETGWESVSSFYKRSSYGNLNITGEVSTALTLNQTTSEFSSNYKKNSSNTKTYTDFVLDAALKKLASSIDLSQYDTDNDGYIDAVWLVYSANYNRKDSSSPFWAYTTWESSPKTIDGTDNLKGCLYSWASIDFTIEKKYPSSITYNSNNTKNGDAHTYIHETGHMLGLDDYYSYDYDSSTNFDTPVGGIDMMDMNIGDHCAFSKYLLGWIKPLVVTEEYLKSNNYELTLSSLTDNSKSTENKAFLLPCYSDGSIRYNGTPFDEYLLIEYSTASNLNESDSKEKYSNGLRGYTKNGVLVYHIDARVGKMLPDSKGNPVWNGTVYDGLPSYSTEWGKKYMFYYLYNNTRSYCYDTNLSDTNSRFYRGRLISLLPASGKRTGDSSRNYSSDSSLFLKGNSFMVDSNNNAKTYSEFVFDDGTKPQYGFTVKNFTTSSDVNQATLTFTEIK